jgi:hypothetical protein
LGGDGQEKGKKRHLTEGMTEETLTDLTVLHPSLLLRKLLDEISVISGLVNEGE